MILTVCNDARSIQYVLNDDQSKDLLLEAWFASAPRRRLVSILWCLWCFGLRASGLLRIWTRYQLEAEKCLNRTLKKYFKVE